MAYLDLCRPCAEAVRAEGKMVMFVSGGRDHKVFCDKCCRRRFGAMYNVVDKPTVSPKKKRVKSHVANNA